MRMCMHNNIFKLMDIYDWIEDIGYVGGKKWTSVCRQHFAQLERFYELWSFQGDKDSELVRPPAPQQLGRFYGLW